MFLTQKQLSRRALLKGMGVTMALPFLEAMVPVGRAAAATAAGRKLRLVCVEMVHGAAGSAAIGIKKNLWAPAGVGKEVDLSATSLKSLEPFRDYLTIVSNCDVRNAEAFTAPEIGGDHFRSTAVVLTQMHPNHTQGSDVARLQRELGAADRGRLGDYMENVREIERRIQQVEAFNRSGEPRELPGAPIGVPDSFSEHAKLMFDLQALAFASDITRVFAFKMGRDASNRTYPESGYNGAFHSTSHHGEREERIMDFSKINTYHVSMIPYFLEKLKNTPDGDSNLLENTMLVYGSPMGDSNLHNHKRVPFFVAGHAGGALKGGLHPRAPDRTPLPNAMLALVHGLGIAMPQFVDTTAALDLNTAMAPMTTDAKQG